MADTNVITIQKKYLKRGVLGLILLSVAVLFFFGGQGKQAGGSDIQEIYDSLPAQAKRLYFQQSEQLTEPVAERLVELDQLTIGCFGPQTIRQMSSEDTNLGGQCCGVLKDFRAYELQLEALGHYIEKNGDIALIPRDPYDLPVEHAQRLIGFEEGISLTAEHQDIFDSAVGMSHHGGPCCCKCWKWYAMSGLAKKLITDYGWDASQIAELWDLSSSCGHDEDVDMFRHYRPGNHAHA